MAGAVVGAATAVAAQALTTPEPEQPTAPESVEQPAAPQPEPPAETPADPIESELASVGQPAEQKDAENKGPENKEPDKSAAPDNPEPPKKKNGKKLPSNLKEVGKLDRDPKDKNFKYSKGKGHSQIHPEDEKK